MGGLAPQMSPTRPTIPGTPNNSTVNQEYLQQLQRSKAMAAQQQPANAAMQQPQPQQLDQSMQQPQPSFEHSTPIQKNASIASVNGQSTPQTGGKSAATAEQHQRSMSRQLEPIPDRNAASGAPSVTPAREKPLPVQEKERPWEVIDGKATYRPITRYINRWAGIDIGEKELQTRVDELVQFRPNIPAVGEMGVIDIRALTMSIRSAMHAETRMALDTLSKLTYEQQVTLELEKCEDLVDVLVDYAEDQLEILANDNPEVSDILDLTPYEDVIHNCRAEVSTLQSIPEVGTKSHDLERTADRLLAITTIFRNLSFHEINHALLASAPVLNFISNAIRLVGTRVLLLRTHVNTFDFMKDLITFFSNTSTKIMLPSKEDAYAILHFLCAFAPTPRPTSLVRFAPYNPKVHRYLPSAVDSLAKLLARDDPNRTFFKQVFANEATSSPPYDLLTRAFALAIAVVPDRTSGFLHDVGETRLAEVRVIEARIAEVRKPYLMQGMLAADILANLAPGSESGVCKSWLESDDGWATSLLKFAMSLCATDASILPPQPDHRMQGRNQRPMDHDAQGYQLIVHRALSMLKRLGDKSKGADILVKSAQTNGHANHEDDDEEDEDDGLTPFDFGGSGWKVKADVLPKKETMLSALLTPSLDVKSLRQFCSIGHLDDIR